MYRERHENEHVLKKFTDEEEKKDENSKASMTSELRTKSLKTLF